MEGVLNRMRGASLAALMLVGLTGCRESYGPGPKPVRGFQPPSRELVVGYREAAAHRLPQASGPLVIRGARIPGFSKELGLWLHVDAAGRVIEVRGDTAVRDAVNRVKEPASHLRFQPFLRDSRPSPAWVQETVIWASREGIAAGPVWNVPGCVGACSQDDPSGGIQAALGRAVLAGSAGDARSLIAAGADPAARFSGWWGDGATYLMLAEGSGVWELVADALARPHDVEARDAKGRTALDWVVLQAPGAEDIDPLIDGLLAAGATRGQLSGALAETCVPKWIAGLVSRGADPNARDARGRTALFGGCPADGVQALLAAGADPTLKDNAAQTAVQTVFTGERDPRAMLIAKFLKERKRRI